MNIMMTRDALRDGLETVAGVLKGKSSLPVVANVLLECTPEGLRITATDLSQTIRTVVPADVSGNGAKAVTLPGTRLTSIAKQLPNAAVRFAHDKKSVKIECARVSFDLQCISADEFPLFPEVSFVNAWTLPAAELEYVKDVAFAVSHDASRPTINGVFWQCRNGRMRMVATDGHRAAIREAGSCCDGQRDLLVPASALELAAKLFADEETVAVACSGNHLAFRSGSIDLVTRLIEGQYVRYEDFFKQPAKTTVTVDREALMAACKRLATVADTPYNARCEFADGEVHLSIQTADVGKGREELACAITGVPVAVGLNVNYLHESLSHIRSEQVELVFDGALTPVVLKPVGDKDYMQILMPMRLKD